MSPSEGLRMSHSTLCSFGGSCDLLEGSEKPHQVWKMAFLEPSGDWNFRKRNFQNGKKGPWGLFLVNVPSALTKVRKPDHWSVGYLRWKLHPKVYIYRRTITKSRKLLLFGVVKEVIFGSKKGQKKVIFLKISKTSYTVRPGWYIRATVFAVQKNANFVQTVSVLEFLGVVSIWVLGKKDGSKRYQILPNKHRVEWAIRKTTLWGTWRV